MERLQKLEIDISKLIWDVIEARADLSNGELRELADNTAKRIIKEVKEYLEVKEDDAN